MYSKIIHDNKDWYGIKVPFGSPLISQIKLIPGRRWSNSLKLWLVPYSRENEEVLNKLNHSSNSIFGVSTKGIKSENTIKEKNSKKTER